MLLQTLYSLRSVGKPVLFIGKVFGVYHVRCMLACSDLCSLCYNMSTTSPTFLRISTSEYACSEIASVRCQSRYSGDSEQEHFTTLTDSKHQSYLRDLALQEPIPIYEQRLLGSASWFLDCVRSIEIIKIWTRSNQEHALVLRLGKADNCVA